jgi:hypothetical protein
MWWLVALADHKCLNARVPARSRLRDSHLVEEHLQLRIEQRYILSPEDLGNELGGGRDLEHMRGDIESGQHQLSLDELVDVVQAGDVGRAVTHHQVGLLATKMRNDLLGRLQLRYVALDLNDAVEGRHLLQVDRHNLDATLARRAVFVQLPAEDLRPGARRGTQVNYFGDVFEYVELLVDLEELESAPRSPAVLFGQSVVDVAFVFGSSAHFLNQNTKFFFC